MVGQHDVPHDVFAKLFLVAELAGCNMSLPAAAAKRFVNRQLTVDPMLDPVVLHTNLADVEFVVAVKPRFAGNWCYEVIQRRGQMVAREFRVCLVVQNLILDAQQLFAIVLNAVLDTAVALGGNPEFEPQFKVTVFLPGNDVTAFAGQMQNATRFEVPAAVTGSPDGFIQWFRSES